jgi:DNA mismatch repair protein MutL
VSGVRVLPEALSNQIAAGEVVDRPASIVKELVENALDAGGRRIVVDIEHGGVLLVRVADDGAGMDREDARLAVLRHATSKLAELADLQALRSFGFRGEALPSIASVSRFEMRTRQRTDNEGTLVRVTGGSLAEVLPIGTATGTVVEVRDLFFNVPARRKFLKTTATESARVTEVIEAAALSEPAAAFFLARDGRNVGEWLSAASREERARGLLASEQLFALRGERGPLSVEAYLSRPERARSGAAWLTLLVNGRPVRDKNLARSVALAYGSVLEPGKYPVGVVYLDLPSSLVDVNVHPQKAEVRFADGRGVGDALYRILSTGAGSAFGLTSPAPATDIRYPPPAAKRQEEILAPSTWEFSGSGSAPVPVFGLSNMGLDESPLPAPGLDPLRSVRPVAAANATSPVPYPTAAEIQDGRRVAYRSLTFVAQLRKTYLLCEGDDGLFFLDQHAAAERVTFHRLKTSYESRGVTSQKLLFPTIVTLSPSETALVDEQSELILRTGLEVRVVGPAAVAVHAVPQLLVKASPERLLRDLLDEVSRAGERAFSGAVDLSLATMACHGSVRAGDALPAEEARALLAALDDAEFAGHCPHGRPVVMRIPYRDLDHRVGRR